MHFFFIPFSVDLTDPTLPIHRCILTESRCPRPSVFVDPMHQEPSLPGCACTINSHGSLWGLSFYQDSEVIDEPYKKDLLCRYSQGEKACSTGCQTQEALGVTSWSMHFALEGKSELCWVSGLNKRNRIKPPSMLNSLNKGISPAIYCIQTVSPGSCPNTWAVTAPDWMQSLFGWQYSESQGHLWHKWSADSAGVLQNLSGVCPALCTI